MMQSLCGPDTGLERIYAWQYYPGALTVTLQPIYPQEFQISFDSDTGWNRTR